MLPEDAWWVHYFEPLEEFINQQRNKVTKDENLRILEKYQTKINTYKMNPKENISAFYIFQKFSQTKTH